MLLPFPSRPALNLDRPALMGILNVTPDSFSDGGTDRDVEAAVSRGRLMAEQGAALLDVGGESTRPGSQRVSADEQVRRVLPVIQRLRSQSSLPLSVDTTLAPVARAALDAGADMINDVSAGRDDPDLLPLVAARGVPVVLMHMRGEPATMQLNPTYRDVVAEVTGFLLERAHLAMSLGVARERIVLDPGIGFGKSTAHNLQLLAHLPRLVALGFPVLLGASRKKFLTETTGQTDVEPRDRATALTTALAAAAGVQLFRVHNIPLNRKALAPWT